MRVRVFEDRWESSDGVRWADWAADCTCGEGLCSPDWRGAMEWACGHLAFSHPRKTWTDTQLDRAYGEAP